MPGKNTDRTNTKIWLKGTKVSCPGLPQTFRAHTPGYESKIFLVLGKETEADPGPGINAGPREWLSGGALWSIAPRGHSRAV